MTSISRNICSPHPQCGNNRNLLSRFFGKNFVKTTNLLKKSLNSWFDETFFSESKFLVFPQCALKMIWRNFFFEWERISRFSTLWTTITQCNISRNLLSSFLSNFLQILREINALKRFTVKHKLENQIFSIFGANLRKNGFSKSHT